MPTITDDRMTLIELVEKQAEGDFVREMLAFATDRIVEAEVEERSFAGAWGSRSLHGRAEMSIEFCNNYRQKNTHKTPDMPRISFLYVTTIDKFDVDA